MERLFLAVVAIAAAFVVGVANGGEQCSRAGFFRNPEDCTR